MKNNIDKEEPEEQEEEGYQQINIAADKGQEPLRIDKFLMNRLESVSRNRIQNAAKAGNILVNQKVVKPNYKVKPYDKIAIILPEPYRELEVVPENIPLNIVYEDDHLLVVNKPAGMVVHPGYGNYSGTLVNALIWHFHNLPEKESHRPGLVHRIDKETSGLLVVAKDEMTMTHLAKQFFDHTIERKYVALVWGELEKEEGTIAENIARSQRDRRKMEIYEDEEHGKPAITHYKVLENLYYVSLIQCQLETGRTHQIRVHMKHLGHPIFNDSTYGGDKIVKGTVFTKYKQFVENCFKMIPRQALHAQSLGFIHPATKEHLFFESGLPDDIQQVLEKWRRYVKFH